MTFDLKDPRQCKHPVHARRTSTYEGWLVLVCTMCGYNAGLRPPVPVREAPVEAEAEETSEVAA